MRTYQMALDDSMLSPSDMAVNPEPVAENFPWEIFEPVRKRYEQARFRHLKRQTRKANGEIKRKRGRPPSCARKLFFVAEEELSQCENDSPGSGGFPAYDFYPLLAAFLVSPLYDCEPNAESIWRELNRNPSFACLCGFDAGDIPSPRTLRRFNRIMAEEGLWEEARRIAVAHNMEEGVIEDSGRLIVDTTHHNAFASVRKPVKACRECKRKDTEREQYIWACPAFHPSRSDETVTCEMWVTCCPRAANGRVYRTNAAEFPQVHWELPQHSRTHKKLYAMRTQVERIISRVKRVLSFERFYGRGKKVLQGFIDRYVTVFNIIAWAAWAT